MSTVTRRRRKRASLPLGLRARRIRLRLLGLRRRRVSPAVAAVLAGLVVVLAAGWFWLRDSSLVTIRQVRITGVSGPHAAQIRGALRASALTMTTLDVDVKRLQRTVEPYPDVVSLAVDTSFPHGITIRVVEQVPLATIVSGGRTLGVGAGGLLLRAPSRADGRLPQLPISVPAGATHVTGPGARAALQALAAAPWPMIGRIAQATGSGGQGIVISLRNGPQLLFGAPSDLRAKWAAAVAVLADSGTAGASYIDVSDPAHPAAGAPAHAGTGTSGAATGTAAGANTSAATGTATGTATSTATGMTTSTTPVASATTPAVTSTPGG